MYEFRTPNKSRPVVVISRDDANDLLDTALVAQVTTTIRGAPTEVPVGVLEGLKKESVVVLDHINAVDQTHLKRCIGTLSIDKMRAVCRALNIATACI